MKPKITTKFFFFFFNLLLATGIVAQTTLEIVSPASISGRIQCAFADFGPQITAGTVSGDIVYVDGADSLGCNPLGIDLTGKIALIDRGGCQFSDKALNAQNAGATGVIIALEPGRNLMFVVPGGTVADQITIPVIAMIEQDWIGIKEVLKSTLVRGDIYMYDEFAGENIIYEETFDGGLNGWTSVNPAPPDSPWVWTADGGADGSVFFVNGPSTQLNGAAIFDANKYSAAVAGGPPPYPDYRAELISPSIDVSDHDDLYIVFYQANWPLNARDPNLPQMGFQYSTNDGVDYSNIIPVETENVFTATETNVVHTEGVRILIEDLNFTENLRLKFVFDGDFYIWALDDIRLVAPPDDELAIESSFYPLLSYATPTEHIPYDTFGFSASILNGGINDQFNVEVKASIVGEDGTVYYTQSRTTDLMAFERLTISDFDGQSAVLDPGNYFLEYNISSPGMVDQIPGNNTQRYPFVITIDTFAHELTAQQDILQSFTANLGDYYFGNFFSVGFGGGPNYFLGSQIATSAADGTLDGEAFTLYLVKWVDDNDGYPDFASEMNMDNVSLLAHPHFELLAVAPIQPPNGTAQHELFDVNIENAQWFDENAQPITELMLEGGTYAVVGEFTDNSIGFSTIVGEPLAGITNVLYNVSTTAPNTWFTGFTNNSYPIIRTTISSISATSVTDNPELEVNIYPTLVEDLVNIEFNLNETVDAEIIVRDMNGKEIVRRQLTDVRSDKIAQRLGNIPDGFYLIDVNTTIGSLQQKIMVME